MGESNIKIQGFPPSWVGIRTGISIIYIDPAYLRTNFSHYPKRLEFAKWPDPIDGLPEALEKADIILVTHHHKDHCKQVTVNRLCKRNTQIIAPSSCVRELGKEITAVETGKEIAFNEIKIKAVDAYNLKRGKSAKIMHKKSNGVGYLVSIGGKIVYHAGDTDYITEMQTVGKVDIALLPIGGRGFTMTIDEAVKATEILNPKIVIPMHYFASDPKEFKAKVESRTTSKVVVLEIGGIYELE